MLEAGVHFGHGTRKWNPRMEPYISAKRKASKGKQLLIVGTKNKATDSMARAAIRAQCPYVNKKWLGVSLISSFYEHELYIEEGIEKKVSATTGFIAGQLMMFMPIYYVPLHLALGKPHTITVLALPYLLFHFFWNNHKDFFLS
ncbi:hypothetical protein Gotur_032729 [Gossypium turneri]